MVVNVALFLENCNIISPKEFLEIIKNKKIKRNIWVIKNEISPADIYCYFYLRFGAPNGIQNFLRSDSSDNLFHWDWTLVCSGKLLTVLGMNFRTEVISFDSKTSLLFTKKDIINSLKKDIERYRSQISKMQQNKLEKWDIFVNPFHQLQKSIDQLFTDLRSLNLDPLGYKMPDLSRRLDSKKFKEEFHILASRYYKGAGLSFSLKMMIPVLAETFINLLIYILAKDDVRNNERLFMSFLREQIDVRIQSLHLKCNGFIKNVKWSEGSCRKFNSLINQRNDLLHGNVLTNSRKISEVFFDGRVPIFKKYETINQQSIGVAVISSGLLEINSDYDTVKTFLEYVMSCLNSDIREQINTVLESRDLGRNRKTNRMGILFSNNLVDLIPP